MQENTSNKELAKRWFNKAEARANAADDLGYAANAAPTEVWPNTHSKPTTPTILLSLNALAIPMSWTRSRLGYINHYPRYHITSYTFTCRSTPDEQVITTQILNVYHQGTPRCHKAYYLGKLNWAFMVRPPLRPMLTPMYAWLKCLHKADPNISGRPDKEISYLAQQSPHTQHSTSGH